MWGDRHAIQAISNILGLLLQALLHASVACRKKLVVEWVEASHLEDVTAKEVYFDCKFLVCLILAV